VRGKGGRRRTIPVEDSELRSVLDGYIEAHKPESDEHLLYPERTGAVRWEDRRKPLSDTAAHRWWHACLDRAGVKHLPMHYGPAYGDHGHRACHRQPQGGEAVRRTRVDPDDRRHLRALPLEDLRGAADRGRAPC
jgi:hypothetical protein